MDAPPDDQRRKASYVNIPPTPAQPHGANGVYTPPASAPAWGPTGQQPGFLSPQLGSGEGQRQGSVAGMSAQMASMGLSDSRGSSRAGRRKDRHAHHTLEPATGSSQAYNGIPQGNVDGTQFLNSSPAHPYAGQPITPAMTQFPAPSGGSYLQGMRSAPLPQSPGQPGTAMDVSDAPGRGVNPDQIPSVPESRDAPAHFYQSNLYRTLQQHLPPPSSIPFTALDQGNASPKYARLTLNNIPASSDGLTSTSLPMGLILQPLAPLASGEQPVPVLDFGDTGPPRCTRCRAYINPFMTFVGGGNKFVCNMCTFPNEVPSEYFAPTDASNVRVDRDQRPELRLGTVEFMVPREYWAKEPVPLRYLFVIDVSQEAVNRGFLEAFCDGILRALYSDEQTEAAEGEEPQPIRTIPEGAKVGFVTFDKEIHFYNCHPSFDQAQMMVMPEIEEPFVPIGSDGLFVDPEESRSVITSLLTQLPKLFSTIKHAEPALLACINAAAEALAATGGKIIASISTLPTWGPGRLFRRDEDKLHGIETERKLFQTENPTWKKASNRLVECGIGIDFFLAAPGGVYMDIATIGSISAQTGGEMFYYPNFHAPRDGLRLALEVKHALERETGYQALMKIRCSNGLQVAGYHGNFHQLNFGADLEFATIDADKALGVTFSYDGKLDSKLDAHFQCALLYTTANGERRVRCINTVASVNDNAAECLPYVDQDAVVSIIAKEAASRMTERTLTEIRGAITERIIDILASYRKMFSGNHPPGQLVLPDMLRQLCIYSLCLLKCRAFKGGIEPSDRRTHTMRLIRSAPPGTISLLLYPRILSLHDMDAAAGFPDAHTQHLVVPAHMRASYSRVREGGAYLVSDGQDTLMWLHAQVSPHLLEDLFGPGQTSLQALDPNLHTLPSLPTHLSAQTRNLLAYWASCQGSRVPTVQLARQGLDGSEFEFARLLVEDRNSEAQSYVDWLVHIHRGIQMELAGQRGRKTEDPAADALAGLRAMGW